MPGRRISVRGTSGSGKSTLGKALAEILQVEFTELDSLNHMPGWTERPLEDFRRLVADRVKSDGWVFDGNYSRVQDLIAPKLDTIVYLDYPLPLILYRLTIRILSRSIRRELLWGTNRESGWRHFFTRDSLYLWVFQTYRLQRQRAAALSAQPPPGVTFIRFKSPGDTNRWLAKVRSDLRARIPEPEPTVSGA